MIDLTDVYNYCGGIFRLARRKTAGMNPYFKGFQRRLAEKGAVRIVKF